MSTQKKGKGGYVSLKTQIVQCLLFYSQFLQKNPRTWYKLQPCKALAHLCQTADAYWIIDSDMPYGAASIKSGPRNKMKCLFDSVKAGADMCILVTVINAHYSSTWDIYHIACHSDKTRPQTYVRGSFMSFAIPMLAESQTGRVLTMGCSNSHCHSETQYEKHGARNLELSGEFILHSYMKLLFPF